jgi:hypothetical protein
MRMLPGAIALIHGIGSIFAEPGSLGECDEGLPAVSKNVDLHTYVTARKF